MLSEDGKALLRAAIPCNSTKFFLHLDDSDLQRRVESPKSVSRRRNSF